MLDYAAARRQVASRPSSPNLMLAIISVHVALLAAVMSAKMDLPARLRNLPIVVTFPHEPPPPSPIATRKHPVQAPHPSIDRPQHVVPLPLTQPQRPDSGPATDPGVPGSGGASPVPAISQPPAATSIHHQAQLLTPPWELKPPYPATKLASEEEATLTLQLTIDNRGRVIAVDPVGPADRAFLDSARRYIIAHWRYAAATTDGQAVGSNVTVTLHFELDG